MEAYYESRALLTENASTIAQRHQLGDREMSKRVRKNLDSVFGRLMRRRNISMVDSYTQMRVKYPDSKIFIISGPFHYSKDRRLQRSLKRQKFIALEPQLGN